MYTNGDLIKDCLDLFGKTEGNKVEIPDIGETVIFEEPIFGFASAKDEIFEIFRRKEVIGANYSGPFQWLPKAKSVMAEYSAVVRPLIRTSGTACPRQAYRKSAIGYRLLDHWLC